MLNTKELKPLVIIGGGGHASVLVDILRKQQRNILAVVSPDDIYSRAVFVGINHLKHDDDILAFPPEQIGLVNGIGVLPKSRLKKKLNEYFIALGYEFETVISDLASVSPFATIENGVQILHGAIVQTGSLIREHSIINSGVIIEHDCSIGKYNHISPNATLCGGVTTKENVYIGAAATVIQNIIIEKNSIVGAGVVITKNVRAEQICYPTR